MIFIFLSLIFSTFLFSQNLYCPQQISVHNRSIYNIGDTLSIEDQNIEFPICNNLIDSPYGDIFSFSDLNGELNGGDHKVTLISMNATW